MNGDRIIVRPVDLGEVVVRGLHIPSTAETEKPRIGEILGVGDGKEGYAMKSKVGGFVLLNKYAGSDVRFVDATYIVLREEEVLAWLSEMDVPGLTFA